jgi:hypothetical protein
MALGIAMLGARHPLVAHLMGTCAAKLGCCLFSLCLRGVPRWRSSLGGLLSEGDGRKAGGCKSEKEQALYELSKIAHTLWELGCDLNRI